MSRASHTWRRRTCTRCSAVFTTRENIDMAHSYMLCYIPDKLSDQVHFNPDILFTSILEAVSHRDNKFEDARAITDTILSKIIASKRPIIIRYDLVRLAAGVLQKFDRAAYVRYVSMR